MAPDHGLATTQLADIYQGQVHPALTAKATHYVEEPTAVFVAGAPGSGIPTAIAAAATRLGAEPVVLDREMARGFHPDYQQLAMLNPNLAIEASTTAVDHWIRQARSDGVAVRAHLVEETTLRRPDLLIDTIRNFKHSGYRVEVEVVATHPNISAIASMAATEYEFIRSGHGRVVPLDYHDLVVAKLGEGASQLNSWPNLVDSLKVTADGVARWQGPSPGQVSNPGPVLRREFARPMNPSEQREFAEVARWVEQAQHQRGASAAEQQPLRRLMDRARELTSRPDASKIAGSRFRRPRIRARRPAVPANGPAPSR